MGAAWDGLMAGNDQWSWISYELLYMKERRDKSMGFLRFL